MTGLDEGATSASGSLGLVDVKGGLEAVFSACPRRGEKLFGGRALVSGFSSWESLVKGSFLELGSVEEDEDEVGESQVEQLFPEPSSPEAF